MQGDGCLAGDGYRRYSVDDLVEGKAACKAALQRVRSVKLFSVPGGFRSNKTKSIIRIPDRFW